MTDKLLDRVEIDPEEKPAFTVIWLHGLGADGHDFEPIVPELSLPEDTPVRFVFPHAPNMPVTINSGMVMRAWYDISNMDLSRDPDIEGIEKSSKHLRDLIQAELDSGMDSKRILLAGFSQGGTIVLHTGPRYEKPLAGILALSTHCPTVNRLDKERADANTEIPIMMSHGKFDPVIPIELGMKTRDTLKESDYKVGWAEYPMEHQVCMEQIDDIGKWMKEIFR